MSRVDIRIEYLADCAWHLPAVAAWQQAQFGYLNPSVTLEQRTEKLHLSMQKDQLPMMLVALSDGGDLLGCAGIVETTITHRHLSPWLSAVYVSTQHRRKGVASALCMRALPEVAAMGKANLYLFTPHDESLYARLGWTTFEKSHHMGLPISLMERRTGA